MNNFDILKREITECLIRAESKETIQVLNHLQEFADGLGDGWISVKDKSIRPPKFVDVLVLIDGRRLDVASVATFFENGEWVTDFENEDITHWQYPPQTPRSK